MPGVRRVPRSRRPMHAQPCPLGDFHRQVRVLDCYSTIPCTFLRIAQRSRRRPSRTRRPPVRGTPRRGRSRG